MKRVLLTKLTEHGDGTITRDLDNPVRCDRCRHWGDPARNFLGPTERGYRKVGTERICGRIGLAQWIGPDPTPEIGAYTEDASGYKADLWTFPDFGCPLFKANE